MHTANYSLFLAAETDSAIPKYKFHLLIQWAEVIGVRLDEMIAAEKLTYNQVNSTLLDGEKQKELLSQDEEEDFLDEGRTKLNIPKNSSISKVWFSVQNFTYTQ